MRYSIHYRTEYRYSGPVHDQHNALRVKPANTPWQQVDHFRVAVEPNARLHSYTDYFGTEVLEFNVPERHDRLKIEAGASVTITPPAAFPAGSWEGLGERSYRDAGGEYLIRAADEPRAELLADLVATARADTPADTLEAICAVVPDRFEYRQGATYVGSTVDDLLEGGAGVCQDFVHLSLILLRSHGIAARYVSGYLFTATDGSDDSGEVDTHAWIEALVPTADGELAWVGADPTNRTLTGDQHVKIGHGRHYGDVPPIKGVFRGAEQSEYEVTVQMTRLRDGSPAPTPAAHGPSSAQSRSPARP